MLDRARNWAGNLEYGAARLHRPSSTEEIQEIVSGSRQVKALGSRHCFSDIADTTGDLISVENLTDIDPVDPIKGTVTVGAGISYGHLCPSLEGQGFAVPNLASLPHISVVGAGATGTHGSGIGNASLSSSISGLQYVDAEGQLRSVSRESDPDLFPALVVGLGGFGVVTRVTLDVIPTFRMQQDVYLGLPESELKGHFEEIEASGYSVSLFTDWSQSLINQVWLKRVSPNGEQVPASESFFGATKARRKMHPIAEIDPQACTEQLGAVGPWFERLPHFKLEFTPSAGEELQSEYLMPRQYAVEAIAAIQNISHLITPHIRCV